jgi:hypothetical protein
MSGFNNAITIGGDDRALQVHNAWEQGINGMKGSLASFAEAGRILQSVKDDLKGTGGFTKWCEDNLKFNQKTACKYMKLNGMVQSGEIDLESGKFTSLRQALGIDHDGEKSTYQKEQRRRADKRYESIPAMATKIEQNCRKNINGLSPDEKRLLAKTLEPIVGIYKELQSTT